MPKGHHEFIIRHFAKLDGLPNKSQQHYFKCNYCGDLPDSKGASIEHHDNALAHHIVSIEECPQADGSACSHAHCYMEEKKQGPSLKLNGSQAEASISSGKKRKVAMQGRLDRVVDIPMTEVQKGRADVKLLR
ncbi:hypothetical protein E1B28_000792 [Marasmius oreades]|uniref:Uncharacterized protein n=1 Tax=Marasmius oreades TaxID=181124 RepID=A0A9P8AEQ5_9AGAR|nr:uncharacterized protein E1B28_000792 [Marasmius oreades]KAG7098892.1 hypothetical protein E1B28_000792 [Marasmius oreades]